MSDWVRIYSAEEDEQIARSLDLLLGEIYRGELTDMTPRVELLCGFHERLFRGVRDGHAGRIRRAGFGAEHLTFGPNRSVERSLVQPELDVIFQKVQRGLESFDKNTSDPSYEKSAFFLAVWAHAEVIRVHPFEDGNGRSSRAFMDWLLVRLGLQPVPIEVPKQEYRDCLNHYYDSGDIEPLLDLVLSLYPRS